MRRTTLLLTASIAVLGARVQAQPLSSDSKLETVVVTGSRVITDIASSLVPVISISADELTATSPQGLTSALGKLPVFLGSTGAAWGGNPGGTANGAASNLNLRNMGAQRILVLFDGHRVAPTQANGTVNVDVLPQMLVQRVEVATGGASAAYGSDAVIGVVNYVLDKNFEGIRYQANAGASQNLYGTNYQLGVAMGSRLFGGRGHLEGTLRFQHGDMVAQNVLPYAKDGQAFAYGGLGTAASPYFVIGNARRNDQPFGGLIGCGVGALVATGTAPFIRGCAAQGMTFIQNGVIGPYDQGKVISGALSSGGTGRRNLYASWMPMTHTIEAFGRASYNLNDRVVASVQLRGAEAAARNVGPNNGLPAITGSVLNARPNIFQVNNPYLTAPAQALLASGNPGCPGGAVPAAGSFSATCVFSLSSFWATLDGVTRSSSGASGQQNTQVRGGLPVFSYGGTDRNLAITADVQGLLAGRWDWDVYYSHDESRESEVAPGNQNFQDTYAAIDAVLINGKPACYVSTTSYADIYPNCDPINPFGPSSLTATQYASFTRPTQYIMTNVMDDAGASVTGILANLPAGPVKASLDAEMRWMEYAVQSTAEPGLVNCLGLRMCSTNAPLWFQGTLASIATQRQTIWEMGGEVDLPLLAGAPGVQRLSANLAGRYTEYSISGAVQTWRAGLQWQINEDMRLRAAMSVDIRAPTLNDLFQPQGVSASALNDVLTGRTGDLALHTGGNPNLQPETGRTLTVGAVLTPSFIPGFSMTVDYNRIRLYGAIGQVSYTSVAIQNICIASAGTSPYCGLATRPFPAFGPGANTTAANFPTYISATGINSATQYTEGVDAEMGYKFDLQDAIGLPGAVTLRNVFSYQPYVTIFAYPGAATQWTPMPKSRNNLYVSYGLGNWSVNLLGRWLGGYDSDTTYGQYYLTRQDRHIPSFTQIDLTLSKKMQIGDTVANGYVSIQNVTNALNPVSTSLAASSNPGTYPARGWGSVLGRYVTIGIRGAF